MTAPDPSLYTIECLTDRCNDCQGHRPRRGISADPVCFCPCHVEAEVREQVAREIEACYRVKAEICGLQRAARIARGDTQ